MAPPPFSSIISFVPHGRRFYRNFTNSSPSSKPGFLPFESVQKLAARRAYSDTLPSSSKLIPERLSNLFQKYDQNRSLPSLKGTLHPSEVGKCGILILCVLVISNLI